MNILTSFIHRRPLPAYSILAYAFAWAFTPLIAISPIYGLPGLFAPALAGLIVCSVTGGRAQVHEYWSRLKIWRVRLVWYLLALGLPVPLSFLVAVLAAFFGGRLPCSLRPSHRWDSSSLSSWLAKSSAGADMPSRSSKGTLTSPGRRHPGRAVGILAPALFLHSQSSPL